MPNNERLGDLSHLPTTITRHLHAEQAMHPEAKGALTSIMHDLELVANSVSWIVKTAGIADVFRSTGQVNIHGDTVIELDQLANNLFKEILSANPHIAGFASEEETDIVVFPDGDGEERKYIIWFDPLDGSSNFYVNGTIGSIFSIYRRISEAVEQVSQADFLQPGREQVCAGYFLYGPSTMFVYTTGHGVNGFTLDPRTGEYVLSPEHQGIITPNLGKYYSVNESYSVNWSKPITDFVNYCKMRDIPLSARYMGSLVGDFHRNLIDGGLYLYPADTGHPSGKLRLCCELNPLAFIAQQAAGTATDGRQRILELTPQDLHQHSPVAIGSLAEVELYEQFMHGNYPPDFANL